LNIPEGFASIFGITIGCIILRFNRNWRGPIAVAWMIPDIIAAILLMTLRNKDGLLFSIYLLNFGGSCALVMILAWITSTFSGYTKRVTANGIIFVGYSLGNILGPQYWKQKYKPRDVVPFGINIVCYSMTIVLSTTIYFTLKRENERRDRLKAEAEASGTHQHEFDEYGYIDVHGPDGKIKREKVLKAYMDLTDKENLSYRYVL